jgi:hypothetical protein
MRQDPGYDVSFECTHEHRLDLPLDQGLWVDRQAGTGFSDGEVTLGEMKILTRFASVALIAAAAALGLAACSPTTAPGSAVSQAPEIVDLGTVDGTTVNVVVSNKIILNSETLPADQWTAKVTDPTLVYFTPGTVTGTTVENPTLQPLMVGTTRVQLTNASNGTIVTFAVNATPVIVNN